MGRRSIEENSAGNGSALAVAAKQTGLGLADGLLDQILNNGDGAAARPEQRAAETVEKATFTCGNYRFGKIFDAAFGNEAAKVDALVHRYFFTSPISLRNPETLAVSSSRIL